LVSAAEKWAEALLLEMFIVLEMNRKEMTLVDCVFQISPFLEKNIAFHAAAHFCRRHPK